MALPDNQDFGRNRMSNYEDAIGRAQAMIDMAEGSIKNYSRGDSQILALTGLARVQLELASMYESTEPQPEVEVEGTDISAELLVAALADGSFRSAVLHELKRPYAPLETQADGVVELVRGVLMGKAGSRADAGFTDADLGGVPKVAEPGRAYTCGLINDDGVMCHYPRHHRDWTNPASHSWNQENH